MLTRSTVSLRGFGYNRSSKYAVAAAVLWVCSSVSLVASTAAAQSGVCTVVATSLSEARTLYARLCDLPRRDCDSIDGRWYCSSANISSSVVPANAMNGQSTATENQSASDNAPNNSNPGSGNTGSSSNGGGKTDTANNTSAPNGESSASGPCIDSDGDGWGWDGSTSCIP